MSEEIKTISSQPEEFGIKAYDQKSIVLDDGNIYRIEWKGLVIELTGLDDFPDLLIIQPQNFHIHIQRATEETKKELEFLKSLESKPLQAGGQDMSKFGKHT